VGGSHGHQTLCSYREENTDAVFYIESGNVKLTVVSKRGKGPWLPSYRNAPSLVKAVTTLVG
jgi:hypothetical protein